MIFFANPLKLCLVGWGPLVDSHFLVSLEMFNRVQVRALAWPFQDIHRCSVCISLLFTLFIFPSTLTNHCCYKRPQQHSTATTMIHCCDDIGLIMNQFNLGFVRLENLVPHSLRVLKVHFCKLQTMERLPLGLCINSKSLKGCIYGCPSAILSHLLTGSLELSDHPVPGHFFC